MAKKKTFVEERNEVMDDVTTIGVRIVRLNSGEEILCNLCETEETYRMKEPAILVPTSERNIGIAPWMPYADINSGSGVEVRKTDTMFVVEPVDGMRSQYIQATTGLITPSTEVTEPVGAGSMKLTT